MMPTVIHYSSTYTIYKHTLNLARGPLWTHKHKWSAGAKVEKGWRATNIMKQIFLENEAYIRGCSLFLLGVCVADRDGLE